MSDFYAMLSRMKLINRWGLMRNSRTENIAEHSLEVAILAHALALIGNRFYGKNLDCEHIATVAMLHDATEIITGDLPTPIKYYDPNILDSYKDIEKTAAEQLIKKLPTELRDDYRNIMIEENVADYKYVKAADKLSAYIKCIEERNTGNKDFIGAEKSLLNTLKSMNMEEVDYFLREFGGAYDLTLDEMGNK